MTMCKHGNQLAMDCAQCIDAKWEAVPAPCKCVSCNGVREQHIGPMFESDAFLFDGRDGEFYLASFLKYYGTWRVFPASLPIVRCATDYDYVEVTK